MSNPEIRVGHLNIAGDHKPGDPPPTQYGPWHEWARAQYRAGLRQRRCGQCSKWKFPQELSDEIREHDAVTSTGVKMRLKSLVCLGCQKRTRTK